MIEEPDGGRSEDLFRTLRKAVLARFLKTAQRAVQLPGEVNLLLADDARLKALNKAFRGKNKATDVLSFPAAENGQDLGDESMAGDLAISVETAARQAAEHGHSLEDELRVLTLHGVLHLAGYDHEADEGEMRALESQLRLKLKLPGGLIERVSEDANAAGDGAVKNVQLVRAKSVAVKQRSAKQAATKGTRRGAGKERV
ncbi:rRNA maturation RNase YbeY [Terriglobus aquaticus]|uniref:Endoribonuclease YbeY n=1 Tax=Terriglobus aquaticus TaxID=940139 RepID=A0ABW9KKL3_9BACT|nr:rRNA maturation RNase YbeY [Terriglobus aquaticus]